MLQKFRVSNLLTIRISNSLKYWRFKITHRSFAAFNYQSFQFSGLKVSNTPNFGALSSQSSEVLEPLRLRASNFQRFQILALESSGLLFSNASKFWHLKFTPHISNALKFRCFKFLKLSNLSDLNFKHWQIFDSSRFLLLIFKYSRIRNCF